MHSYFLKFDKRNWPPREGAYVLDGERVRVRLGYVVGKAQRAFRLSLTQDADDRSRALNVGVPGAAGSVVVHVDVDGPKSNRQIGVTFDLDGWLHWNFGRDRDECGRDNTWQKGLLNWKDELLGEVEQSRVVTRTVRTSLSLPEGVYPCTVELVDVAVWNKNLPRSTRSVAKQCEVKFDEPAPPFPGKGENAYDVDDDSLHMHSGPGATVTDALASCFRFVMAKRERHGGLHWTPGARTVPVVPDPSRVKLVGVPQELLGAAAEVARHLGLRHPVELHRAAANGMVLVKLARVPSDEAFRLAEPHIRELARGLAGMAAVHVVFNIGGTLKVLVGVGDRSKLVPFDAFHLWPAPLPASALAA